MSESGYTPHHKDLFRRILTTYPILSPLDQIECEKYYLLYWNTSYFTKQIKNGMIAHQEEKYQVCYGPRIGYASIAKSRQLKLSFRKAHAKYNLPGYVIVSIHEGLK